MSARQRVAVVTGGGGGIGAAIAEELGRGGWFVVTVDPLVTLDGSEVLPEAEESTAGRIVAAGGSARASSASVTDGEAVRALFGELVDEHGGLDAVVNVAGITRQTYFGQGTEEDWLAVLAVHLSGYLNVLEAALPLMAAAGHGRVLGVTSGSGWRAADAGAYSCAKRAVAALTWQLGRLVPAGVTVNAMSPIAATRMVAAALERARQAGRSGGGGISFLSMPGPEDLGPLGAFLVGEGFGWCTGRVLFAGGSEVAVIDEPRLLEVVRTDGVVSLAPVLDAVIPRAFAAAERGQASDGGGNPRFGPVFDEPAPTEAAAGDPRSCVVVTDRPELAAPLIAALEARSVSCHRVEVARGFAEAGKALSAIVEAIGPIDAIVVAEASGQPMATSTDGWERVLAEHRGIIEHIHTDAGWARAAADYAAASARSVQLVTLTDATTGEGRSRAQASAQQARVSVGATEGRVTAFAVSIEASGQGVGHVAGQLVAHLLDHPEATALAGAELVIGMGWFGLRSHPRPIGSITYGGPAVPVWLDATLREIVGVAGQPLHLEA
ncbi:MAG TPA: SDR family NAD(P)-dependent oxidoreductase [Acidimicrobiales bacterium]|nr:SDR family NAD(P)-dependent oxidoreductase [Acidimicrobiales bacterium]